MLPEMPPRTPFYPKRQLSINDAYNRLERELFGHWSLFNSGKPINVTNCEGKHIQGGGIEFDGSPREIFWRFFDPDIRKVITDHIEETVKDCEGMPDTVENALNETRELLSEFLRRAYERLAHIDQRLRGKGFPNSVVPQNVEGKIQLMQTMLDEHVEAAIRHAALKRWGSVLLEPEQKDLLTTIAEAARNVPEDKRQAFFVGADLNLAGSYVAHPGLVSKRPVSLGDMDALKNEKLINVSTIGRTQWFDITPRGFAYYRFLQQQRGAPTERIEVEMRRYIDSARFAAGYPEAYRKWLGAEELLWAADSHQQLTTIGHHCREAMQDFAETLINRYSPPNVEPDKAKTVARVRAVFDLYAMKLGDKEKKFLDALLAYWGTVSDLTQRQEHGSQKEGRPLIWEDARRVVFQTLLVMYEIDKALTRFLP